MVMGITEWIKACWKEFMKKMSVFSYEKNGIDNLKRHIDCLDLFLVEKIQEGQMCEEQLDKIKRAIRIRRIRSIFGFFSFFRFSAR